MSITRKIGTLLGTAAVAVSIAGVPANPAAAETATTSASSASTTAKPDLSTAVKVEEIKVDGITHGWVTIYIYTFGDGSYWLTAWGEAYTYQDGVQIDVYGQDTFYDDNLWDSGGWVPTKADGTFYFEYPVAAGTFDEDWGLDEIIAVASFHRPGYTFPGQARSNVVKGYF